MINWDYVHNLSPGEFSEDPNEFADPALMYSLGNFRKLSGCRMFPSPVSGALARFYGSSKSQHYAVDRKSTASDMFIEGVPFDILSKLLHSNLFIGIGIYLDTKGPDGLPWVMFHLDIRPIPTPVIWITTKVCNEAGIFSDEYTYPKKDNTHWRLLNDERFFKNKLHGFE